MAETVETSIYTVTATDLKIFISGKSVTFYGSLAIDGILPEGEDYQDYTDKYMYLMLSERNVGRYETKDVGLGSPLEFMSYIKLGQTSFSESSRNFHADYALDEILSDDTFYIRDEIVLDTYEQYKALEDCFNEESCIVMNINFYDYEL